MLESLRDFAAETLASTGELDSASEAHAALFLALAERAAPELTGRDQALWLDRLQAEQDNLRAALAHLEGTDVEKALRMGAALWRFWLVRGHQAEGRTELGRLLALGRAAGSRSAAWVRILNSAGIVTLEQGDRDGALAILQEGVEICRQRGEPEALATALSHLGWTCMGLVRLDAARACSEEALGLYRTLGDRRGIGAALQNLAITSAGAGLFPEAEALLRQNLALRRELGEQRGIAYAHHLLAWTAGMEGAYLRARENASQGLAAIQEVGDRQIRAALLTQRGMAELALRCFPDAGLALEEALLLWRELGNRDSLALILFALRELLLQQGKTLRAHALNDEAEALWSMLQTHVWHAHPLRLLGVMAHQRGDPHQAMRLLRASRASLEALGDTRTLADCLLDLAAAAEDAGHVEEAGAAREEARLLSIPGQPPLATISLPG